MKGFVKQCIKEFKTGSPLIWFSVLVTVVCVLNIVLNTINGRFWLSDFKVYYMAAKTMLSGGRFIYNHSQTDQVFINTVRLFFFLPSLLYF